MADERQFSVLRAGAGHSPTDRVQKSSPANAGTLSSPTTASAGHSNANPRSCVTCRRRKVKCDKKNPCGNCQKARIECVFPSPARMPRKPRRAADGELLERLRRLEGALQSLGAQVDEEHTPEENGEFKEDDPKENFKQWRKVGTDKAESHDGEGCPSGAQPSANQQNPDMVAKFGRLVINQGKSRYINNSFWANLNAEVEDLKGMFDASSDEEEDYPSPDSSEQSTVHQAFIFSFSSTKVNMLKLHPPRESLPRIWSLFQQNVDPLVKVLHIPTIEPVILDAKDHLDNLPRGLEALLFSVYYGVVTSLSADECFGEFGETQQVLLTRYRFALEQALARASFLDSQEVIVLQAAVIFLLVLRRNDDARITWTLTGLIVRIAQNLGVHRDGSHFNLSPFEIEMRRRLWWQVCILDARASEDHGCDPTILEAQFDTQMPLNVNDSDLHPDMKELPESRKGFTEMTFCLIRFEVANIFRRILYVPPGPVRCNTFFASLSVEQKEKWIAECHQRIEETYLQDIDLSVPLYWVAATLSRLILSKMWLVIYHPFQRLNGGASLPQATKDKLFISSLEGVEYSVLLDTDPRTRKWGWLFKTYVQWHAIAFLFSELCVRTSGPLVDRAWRALEGTVRTRFGNTLTDSKRTILWRPLRKLMAKAREARRRQVMADMEALGISKAGMLMESYPNIDRLLSRASSQWDSGAKLSPGQKDWVLGDNSNRDYRTSSRQASESARSPPLASANSPYKNTIDLSKSPAKTSNQFPPQTTRAVAPGYNQAAHEFNMIADNGMDWLVGDMMDGEQPAIPDISQEPSSTLNTYGNVPTESSGSGSMGLTPEEMNWESWDDLVKEVAAGVPGVNSEIGMSTWF